MRAVLRSPAAPIVAAAALALLAVLVTALVSVSTTDATASGTATCDLRAVQPFDCTVYEVEEREPDEGTTGARSASAWFDSRADGSVELVLSIADRYVRVPVRLTDDGGTSDRTLDARFASDGSDPDSDYGFRSRVAAFFSQPAVFEAVNGGFNVRAGERELRARTTGRVHEYPETTAQTVAGRTLLTHPGDGSTYNMALNSGPLGVDEAGCVTAGAYVLVLPRQARLHDDGSVEFDGQRWAQGEAVELAGGTGSIPGDRRCGIDEDYWWR